MSESRIARVTGRAIALRGNDIDTDRIIPARFLKTVTFDGLERHAFEDDRAADTAAGRVHPLDSDAAAGASILLVNKNFGCGSSREHAPQALYRRGFRAVVGESFAEIFFSNSLLIGLVCVTVSEADARSLMALADAGPVEMAIDLEAQTVAAGGRTFACSLPAHARHALVTGQWDAAGLLLEHYDEVAAVDARLPYLRRAT